MFYNWELFEGCLDILLKLFGRPNIQLLQKVWVRNFSKPEYAFLDLLIFLAKSFLSWILRLYFFSHQMRRTTRISPPPKMDIQRNLTSRICLFREIRVISGGKISSRTHLRGKKILAVLTSDVKKNKMLKSKTKMTSLRTLVSPKEGIQVERNL